MNDETAAYQIDAFAHADQSEAGPIVVSGAEPHAGVGDLQHNLVVDNGQLNRRLRGLAVLTMLRSASCVIRNNDSAMAGATVFGTATFLKIDPSDARWMAKKLLAG